MGEGQVRGSGHGGVSARSARLKARPVGVDDSAKLNGSAETLVWLLPLLERAQRYLGVAVLSAVVVFCAIAALPF